jgi:hypothetical protein
MRRKQQTYGELTASELAVSRNHLIHVSQLESFPHEYESLRNDHPLPKTSKIARFHPILEVNLIRLGGRLQFAKLSTNEKHPLLLDGDHHFTQLLIRQTHVLLHHLGVRVVLSELRDNYWILRGKQNIKKVLRTCLPCKIAKNTQGQELEAPLPQDRVKPSPPFSLTGLDFAGPLYIKKSNTVSKAYFLLFTCATTKALHLELSF